MCRILGIVAGAPAAFRFCLHDAPRSLGALSKEHPDGWGVAVYDARAGWNLRKQPLSAFADPSFVETAGEARGQMLVAHVRRGTVGAVTLRNTHPFQRGRWVFAHNGTIEDQARLRAGASEARLAEIRGTTDSELFFAYLLTRLDAIGASAPPEERRASPEDIDAAVLRAIADVATRPSFGACNFLLADGDILYAFRMGRTLHVLERSPDQEPTSLVPSPETGSVIEARWAPRQRAVLIASEEITDEAWAPVKEGQLLKIDRNPEPALSFLAAL